MGMKKLFSAVIAVFAIFGIAGTVPAQANEKSVVIIDSYFDKSRLNGNYELVCLASDGCVNVANRARLGTDPAEHGTVMANIAFAQNPGAKFILIQTENVARGRVSQLGGNDFLNALNWVAKNTDRVLSVSFSYTLTGNATKSNPCALATVDRTNVRVVDPAIRSTVATLKQSNILVFAAAGNDARKPVAYPACIEDVVSVGVTSGGKAISRYHSTAADLVANLSGGRMPAIQFTTSVGTVIAATNSIVDNGILDVVN